MEHHVYFWLKSERQNESDRAAFEAGLKKLFEIPGVAGGIAARPAAVAERPVSDQSWDYALSLRFASVSAHDLYQDHPDHHEFVDGFSSWWEKGEVRDLEEI